jgi:hypothetical protein
MDARCRARGGRCGLGRGRRRQRYEPAPPSTDGHLNLLRAHGFHHDTSAVQAAAAEVCAGCGKALGSSHFSRDGARYCSSTACVQTKAAGKGKLPWTNIAPNE